MNLGDEGLKFGVCTPWLPRGDKSRERCSDEGRRGLKKALQWKPTRSVFFFSFFYLLNFQISPNLKMERFISPTMILTPKLHCILLCPFPSYSVVLFPVSLVNAGDLGY